MSAVPTPPEVKRNPLKVLRLPAAVRFSELMQMSRLSPVVHLRMGPIQTYLLLDAEGVKHVLQDNHLNYEKGKQTAELKHFLGEGLFTSEGEFWKRQRRLAQPAFHRQQLAALTGLMTQTTARMLDRWTRYAAAGESFDLAHEMMRLTLATVSEALFHHDLDAGSAEVGAALSEVMAITDRRMMSPLRAPMGFPTPQTLRFRRALATLDRKVEAIITERRKATERPHDLLTMFMEVRDADTGESMTDHQLRDEVMTMVLAGHETTANALSWTFYLLSTHPEIEARLRAELDAVLGGRTPAIEDLPKLTYTLNVFQEAMRLYPPVWMFVRQAKGPDTILGFPVKAGQVVSISPYALHHNPKYWENPQGFDPDRFLPERSKERPRFAYLPFSGGPRQCIGNHFALMEAQVILAMVLQRHRVVVDPTGVVEPNLVLTLRPKYGVKVVLHPPPARPVPEAAPPKESARPPATASA